MKRRILLGMALCALPLAAALYDDFRSPPDATRPWCYWYWVNGNVDRETVTADLEAMKRIGFGGVLMFDPRGYDKVVKKPEVKLAFGSPEWRQMVVFAVQECARLGLEFTMNLSDCGGSLKGPWKTGADGPKRLVCGVNVKDVPADYKYYSDIATVEVTVPADAKVKDGWRNAGGVVNRWEHDRAAATIPVLAADAPGGRKVTLRFGFCAIPKREFDVDVIDADAVARHFDRFTGDLFRELGPLVGTTFTHVYSVSWEGAIPTWTARFEEAFRRRAGYELRPHLPLLAGFGTDAKVMKDYRRVRNDLFRDCFYGTVRRLAHARGVKLYSESGGPWNRGPSVFLEADQLSFLGVNDMPQRRRTIPTSRTTCPLRTRRASTAFRAHRRRRSRTWTTTGTSGQPRSSAARTTPSSTASTISCGTRSAVPRPSSASPASSTSPARTSTATSRGTSSRTPSSPT